MWITTETLAFSCHWVSSLASTYFLVSPKHKLNVWLLVLVFVPPWRDFNFHKVNHRAPLSWFNSSDLFLHISCPHPQPHSGLFITQNFFTSKILSSYIPLSDYFFPLRTFISLFPLLLFFGLLFSPDLISSLQPNFLPFLTWPYNSLLQPLYFLYS